MKHFLAITCVLTASSVATAAPPDYARDVRPILAEHCFQCHGTDEKHREAGLRLDLREAATAKLESSAIAIVPNKPEASEMIARIKATDTDTVMPPPSTKKKLKPREVQILEQWIAGGAQY